MNKIYDIKGREILDSRGYPTLEVEIILENGIMERASVPCGLSVGKYESIEIRDLDPNRWNGYGLYKAIELIEKKVSPNLRGKDISNPFKIDRLLIELDGTKEKANYGSNVILAISITIFKLSAKINKMYPYIYLGGITSFFLPCPMVNIINGGVHSNNGLDFQEFMIIPIEKKDSFREKIEKVGKVFHQLKKNLIKNGHSVSTGDEGGFAPQLKTNEEALEYIIQAIFDAGLNFDEIKLALDIASNELYDYKKKRYILKKTSGKEYTTDEWIGFYKDLLNKYPIISLEDPIAEEDYIGWECITKNLSNIQLVGDDLFVTNKERLKIGIDRKLANSILLKPNQIGSITEMIEVYNLAKKNGYASILSHRSGETEETFISDLSVGLGISQIKFGSISRGERTAKYNQLLRIEENLLFK